MDGAAQIQSLKKPHWLQSVFRFITFGGMLGKSNDLKEEKNFFPVFWSDGGAHPPIFPYYNLVLFLMRQLKATCHLEEGPAASHDKWIIDGIHPGARLGQ